MATCKQTAQELIQDVFSPCIAVLCSSDAEAVCAKNNLSFVEMVQPFCRINTEITIRDPSNVPSTIKNFRVVMKDMYFQSPTLPLGKKMMHDAVSANVSPIADGILCNSLNTENYSLKYYSATPWFEAYRDVFFQVISPMEHEFMHHYLACIFVVSSSHHDPLSQINDLSQQQMQHQQQNSSHNARWLFSYIFKYYLLLHDVSTEDLTKAETVYQSMKSFYGSSSCHLLQINSINRTEGNASQHEEMNGTLNMPDPWSQFLSKFYAQQDTTPLVKSVENSAEFPEHIDEGNEEQLDGVGIITAGKTVSISHPLLCTSEHSSLVSNFMVDCPGDETTKSCNFGSGGKWPKSISRNKRHGVCLTLSDMDRIRVFVQDFSIQGLVPFVEKQIRILSDQVANRKGIHRTIFGVTKKIFGGNRPGAQGIAASSNSVVYGQDAPELQVRKLGDLAFMFQLYDVAYQAYHNAKRDFNSDQAWLYFAGASEMAALSVFMQGNSVQHEYPSRYIETAITTYLYSCKFPELATRATLLSTECLKNKGLYKDAAAQFIRMSGDSDLPSALFLEQGAHCYINCKPPKIRKYAFHIILAGHRFSKAGQRKHALRAYKQAEQVYKGRGWNFADDHINFTIGRLSVNLKQLESACAAFKPLLATQSQQPAMEQANFLREYLFVLKQLLNQKAASESYELPSLPVPAIDFQTTRVLLGDDNILNKDGYLFVSGRGFERGDLNNNSWSKLEEIVIVGLWKTLPPLHYPQLQCLTANTDNSSQPIAVVGETISVEICIKNPLCVLLTIDNVFLLWSFTSSSSDANNCKEPKSVSNEVEFSKASLLNSVIQTEVLPQITLEALQEKKLHLTLKPQLTGDLLIKGVAYSLRTQLNGNQQPNEEEKSADAPVQKPLTVLSIQGKQSIELKGPRLNRTTSEKTGRVYATDYRLHFQIVSPMPKLQVKYKAFPTSLLCGEVQQVIVEFSNIGQRLLQKIIVASPTPGMFALGTSDMEIDCPWQVYKELASNRQPSPVMAQWEYIDWKVEVLMPDGSPCRLHPGESLTLPMWLRGPDTPGEHNLDILFYYETEPPHPKLRHRLLQHSSILITYPSITVRANAMKSFCFEEKLASTLPGSSANSLVLAVEAENISEELSEVSVVQVSCISQNWCLCSSDDSLRKGLPVIHPQEILHLTLKAIGFNTKTTVSSQKVMVFSYIPLGRVEIDSSTTPCSDFSCRSRLHLPDLLTVDTTRKSAESSNQKNVTEKMERDENVILILTVIWKAKMQKNGESSIVMGQHHVAIEKLSSVIPVSNVQEADEGILPISFIADIEKISDSHQTADLSLANQAVKCTLCHPFHVQHNFTQRRLITVPVVLVAYNSCNADLQVIVDNTSDSQSHPSGQLNSPEDSQGLMYQQFTWAGASRREIELKPNATVRVPLEVVFSSPGTYNLGNINIKVGSEDEEFAGYSVPPSLIIISSCDVPTPCT